MSISTVTIPGTPPIDLAFERFGNPTDPAALLIMGAGAQMISWPLDLCRQLADTGLQMIRFDNRDSGLSTHLDDAPVPDFPSVLAGDFSQVTYTLSDMAADTIGLADALGLKKIHLVGASMGGMIAQTVAIEYPDRTRSLTSMMSSTGAPNVGLPDFSVLSKLGSPPLEDRQAYIEWRVRSLKAIGSPGYPFDETSVAENAGLAWDRDHDPHGIIRQTTGVIKSGDRTEKLKKLLLPTLVIHGDADKMIDVSGGQATAAAIPNSELHIFPGMGHGFPQPLWKEMAQLIAAHIHRAEKQDQP
ncbi:MAG: alpha/beta hydrolase [Saprospiraceae bacterium]